MKEFKDAGVRLAMTGHPNATSKSNPFDHPGSKLYCAGHLIILGAGDFALFGHPRKLKFSLDSIFDDTNMWLVAPYTAGLLALTTTRAIAFDGTSLAGLAVGATRVFRGS